MWSFFLCSNIRHISWNILWNFEWAYRLNQSNLLSDEEKYRILKEILPGIDWDQEPEADEEKDYLQELAIEIGNVKNNCMDIEEYEPVKYTTEKFRETVQNL